MLVSWWRGRKRADEIAAINEDIRVDIGLGSRELQWWNQLRFIATPDRIGRPPRSRES